MGEWFNDFQEFFYMTYRLVLFVGTAGLVAVSLGLAFLMVLEAIFTKPMVKGGDTNAQEID